MIQMRHRFFFPSHSRYRRKPGCTPDIGNPRTLNDSTLEAYDSPERFGRRTFERDTILKPTHLSGAVIAFDSTRALPEGGIGKTRRWFPTDYCRETGESNYKSVRRRAIPEPLERPGRLDAALDAASALANAFPFCRVGLHLPPGGAVKAGEIAFLPPNGARPFDLPAADFEPGRMANAPIPD